MTKPPGCLVSLFLAKQYPVGTLVSKYSLWHGWVHVASVSGSPPHPAGFQSATVCGVGRDTGYAVIWAVLRGVPRSRPLALLLPPVPHLWTLSHLPHRCPAPQGSPKLTHQHRDSKIICPRPWVQHGGSLHTGGSRSSRGTVTAGTIGFMAGKGCWSGLTGVPPKDRHSLLPRASELTQKKYLCRWS